MNIGHQWYKRLSVLLVGVLLTLALCVNPGWGAEEAINATTYDSAPGGSVTYTGSWTHDYNWPRAYSSTVSYVNQYNAKVALTFNGRYITRVYTTANNRGKSRIYIDGAQKNNAATDKSTNTRWQVARTWDTGSSGQHTIEVYNDGGYIDADAFIIDIGTVGNGTYDNTHSQLKYIGTWDNPSSGWSAAYNNTLRWTNSTDNAVSFTFTGDSVTYLYTKGSNRGVASVTIDGVDKGTIDLYSGPSQFQQGTTYSGLGSTIHTIHIAATGQKNGASNGYYIDVDAFKVGAVYNRTAAVDYANTWAYGRNANYPNYGSQGDNPCNDCTNFVSQVLQAGGLPTIANFSQNDSYAWYVYSLMPGWAIADTWKVTSSPNLASMKSHADAYPSRYQFVGQARANVESLGRGDFFLLDDDVNPFQGPDHASVIVGEGFAEEPPEERTLWRLLRNAHCNDRKKIRWDYGIDLAVDAVWAYRVVY